MPAPRVAIVGRPNVGKSSLLNMIARERLAIVDDQPGVTRDRLSVLVDLKPANETLQGNVGSTQTIELTDTGGYGVYVAEGARYDEIGADLATLTDDVEKQIAAATEHADLVLFAVDTQAGLTPRDEEIATLLREQRLGASGRPTRGTSDRRRVPVRVVATKVDSEKWEPHGYELSALGFGEPMMCSATSNYMRRTLLDDLHQQVAELIDADPERFEPEDRDPGLRVAIVGKRNSGKSTLVNRLAGEDRVIVSEIAGTTRDAIDVRIERPDGSVITAIDTAGLRRKKSFQGAVEWYAFDRAKRAIARADVVLLLVDAREDVSQVDEQLAALIVDSHKPVAIVVNKWDLAEGRIGPTGKPVGVDDYEKYVRKELKGLAFAPIAFMSAKDGLNVEAVMELGVELGKQAATRIPTGPLNRTIRAIINHRPPSMAGGMRPRIYFASQVRTDPPTIVLVVNHPQAFEENYRRYMMNRLREELPFSEVPVRLVFRDKRKLEEEASGRKKSRKSEMHEIGTDGEFDDGAINIPVISGAKPIDLESLDDDQASRLDDLLMDMPTDADSYFDE